MNRDVTIHHISAQQSFSYNEDRTLVFLTRDNEVGVVFYNERGQPFAICVDWEHPQLGRVVTQFNKIANDVQEDPMNDYAGFTPDPTPLLERFVKSEGFDNLEHFRVAVAARTSGRVAYFQLAY